MRVKKTKKLPELEAHDKRLAAKKGKQSTRGFPGDVFVACADGTFLCDACLPVELRRHLGDDDVEVWEVGSGGWTGAPVCRDCKCSIPVVVDGESPLTVICLKCGGANVQCAMWVNPNTEEIHEYLGAGKRPGDEVDEESVTWCADCRAHGTLCSVVPG